MNELKRSFLFQTISIFLFVFLVCSARISNWESLYTKAKIFGVTDINQDGMLTKQELIESLKSSSDKYHYSNLDIFISEYDLNNDGMVSIHEYLSTIK